MYTFYKEKENKGLGNYIYQTHIMGSVILIKQKHIQTQTQKHTNAHVHKHTPSYKSMYFCM